MNDSDTAGMVAGRREQGTDLCARMERLAKANARLRVGLAFVLTLGAGIGIGGLTRGADTDSIIAFTATDDTIYRVYESGLIEYLRVEKDPPRTVEGVFDWGVVKVDDRFTLQDRP